MTQQSDSEVSNPELAPMSPPNRRGTVIAVSALMAIPTLLLIDTLISFARGWRIPNVFDGILTGAVVGWFVLTGLLCMRSRFRAACARNYKQIVLLLVFTTASWTAMEIALAIHFRNIRWLDLEGGQLRLPFVNVDMHPDPRIFPGASSEAHFTVNSVGVRATELPPRDAAYRILCVGGSTTECVYLDDDMAWPGLLMRTLNAGPKSKPVWIGNAGVSGTASIDHLLFLQTSRLVDQMDCIVVLAGINDFMAHVKGTDLSRESGLLNRQLRPVWEKSMALVLIRFAARHKSKGLFAEEEGGQGYEQVRQSRRDSPVRDDLPEMRPGLELYRQNLEQMCAVCREKRLRLILMTQPVVWNDRLTPAARNRLMFGLDGQGRYLTVGKMREGMDLYNSVALDVARQENVTSVDLSSLNGREDVFYDDCHFTEAGSREVVRLLLACFR
jgi:lysophospholipase L1-like esterase